MFTRHVTGQLVAYLHGELNEAASHRVAAHLQVCARCRAELDDLRLSHHLMAQLPLHAAPDRIWNRVEAALPETPGTPAGFHPRLHRPANRFRPALLRRIAIAILLLGCLVPGGYLASIRRLRHPQATVYRPGWTVKQLAGEPVVNMRRIRGNGRLQVGQWLVTDAVSRAELDVAGIGQVEVEPDSRVKLIETSARTHHMALDHGVVSAHIQAPPRLFLVDTPSAVAVDLGCSYKLEVDRKGNSILHVLTGQVALETAGHETIVTTGGICETRRGIGTGTPYMEGANPDLRQALTRFDFDNGGVAALKAVLAHASQQDTLTVWNLLFRVPSSERGRVVDWLTRYFPLPQGVTRKGILNLEPVMVASWKFEVGLAL